MAERKLSNLSEGSCIEANPGLLKSKVVLNSIAISREILPNQPNKLTHESMQKQIQNLLRKIKTLGMSSVSLSCLIEEPSSISERELFINAFLAALKQFFS
jgi:hypothetical protein